MLVGRAVTPLLVGIATIGLAAACVGDDPPAAGPGPDASTANDGAVTPDDGAVPSDGGSGTDGDADTGPKPPSIPDVALWLDATRGVEVAADKVTRWLDQSGLDNHASPPDAVGAPRLLANGIGGRPSIAFDGATSILRVADAASLRLGAEPFTITVVIRHTTPVPTGGGDPNGYGPVIAKRNNSITDQGFLLWANYPAPVTTGFVGETTQSLASPHRVFSNGSYNDNLPHVVVFQRTTAQLSLRIDGSEVAANADAAAGDNVDGVGVDLTIGARLAGVDAGAAIQPIRGEIAEVVIVKGLMSGVNLANLESYLDTKYGL